MSFGSPKCVFGENDHISNPKHSLRILSISLAVISNIILLSIVLYKIFIKKEKRIFITRALNVSSHKKKSVNYVILMLILTLFFQIFTPLYNLLYRYIIPYTCEACRISDSIEETIIAINRLILILFYIVRLKQIFKSQINCYMTYFFYTFAFVQTFLWPSLWIPSQSIKVYKVTHFGIYCSNTGEFSFIIMHFICDFLLTLMLAMVFVMKLMQIYYEEKGIIAAMIKITRRNSTRDILNINDDEYLTRKVTFHRNAKLIILAKRNFILTVVSIISSWLFIYNAIVDDKYALAELRWFYPLDYCINGLCIFFMFKWKGSLFRRCDRDCYCFKRHLKDNEIAEFSKAGVELHMKHSCSTLTTIDE